MTKSPAQLAGNRLLMTQQVDDALLRVIGLRTYFFVRRGTVKAVDGVDFSVRRGECLGLVGESGCGKSVTGLSILRLVEPPGRIVGGSILFKGEDILSKSERDMRKLRGSEITMIQQNPDSSLNPVFTIGQQVAEAIIIHQELHKRALTDKVLEMLRLVKIASPKARLRDYPHQMSGGMRQRVAGAIALSCQASLLIADEATTNLDVTTQKEYLQLLKEIQSTLGTAIILVTHDFGIVSGMCDRIAVMYAGKIVESGTTPDILQRPKHPYTVALLSCIPRVDSERAGLPFIEGEPPDPVGLRPGCSFAVRCSSATDVCLKEYPGEVQIDDNHSVSCFHAG